MLEGIYLTVILVDCFVDMRYYTAWEVGSCFAVIAIMKKLVLGMANTHLAEFIIRYLWFPQI